MDNNAPAILYTVLQKQQKPSFACRPCAAETADHPDDVVPDGKLAALLGRLHSGGILALMYVLPSTLKAVGQLAPAALLAVILFQNDTG